jgi:hypothetical protein
VCHGCFYYYWGLTGEEEGIMGKKESNPRPEDIGAVKPPYFEQRRHVMDAELPEVIWGQTQRITVDAIISEKLKAYNDLAHLFIDMAIGKPKPSAIQGMGKKLSQIGFQLFIAAPDSVVTAYLKWRTLAISNESAEQTMRAFSELLLEMRRDIVGETTYDIETALDMWG